MQDKIENNKLKLAACGIDCNKCGSYLVTTEQDLESAEGLVCWYRNMGWIGKDEGAVAVLEKSPLCYGCWNASDECFFKCSCFKGRNLRVCCQEKQINHCGECAEFPCDDYVLWVGGYEHHQKAMDYLLSLRKS